MKTTILIFIVLFISFNCNNANTSTNQEQPELNIDYKKYHVPDKHLRDGVVRVYEKMSNGEKSKTYRLIKGISENKFYTENYNNNFEISRKDVYLIEKDGFIEDSVFLYISEIPKEVKIITPQKYSYSPKNQYCKSEYIFEQTSGVSIIYKTKTNFIGNSTQIYEDEEIDCLKFKSETLMKYNDMNFFTSKTKTIISDAYYAENIGFFKSVTINDADTSIVQLIDIINIEEFEELKNQN